MGSVYNLFNYTFAMQSMAVFMYGPVHFIDLLYLFILYIDVYCYCLSLL